MKRTVTGFVAVAIVLAFADIASAVDLPMKAPALSRVRPLPSAPGWTGFYLGVHGGYGFAGATSASRLDLDATTFFAPASFDLGDSSPLVGVQAGYNRQFGHAVLGVEADVSGAGLAGFGSRVPIRLLGIGAPAPAFGAESFMRQDVRWLASVRGRLGYAFGAGLIYATGGAAWANVDHRASTTEGSTLCSGTGCALPAAFGSTRPGWVVGGGYEWPVAPDWTLRGEYLFYRFDGAAAFASAVSSGLGTTCPNCRAAYAWSDLDIHALRIGLSYRPDQAAARPWTQAQASAGGNWSGFHAGVHGGWAFARASGGSATSIDAVDLSMDQFFVPAAFDLGDNGPLFGAQIGYDRQVGDLILGVEADVTGSGIRGFDSRTPHCLEKDTLCGTSLPWFGAGSFMRQDVNWLASLRGRVGHLLGPGFAYVTGGAAWARIDYEANTTDARFACPIAGCAWPASFSDTKSGWVVGGGYEWAAWSSWTLRGEYLFYRFGGASAAGQTVPGPDECFAACTVSYKWSDLDIHALRLALNYRW